MLKYDPFYSHHTSWIITTLYAHARTSTETRCGVQTRQFHIPFTMAGPCGTIPVVAVQLVHAHRMYSMHTIKICHTGIGHSGYSITHTLTSQIITYSRKDKNTRAYKHYTIGRVREGVKNLLHASSFHELIGISPVGNTASLGSFMSGKFF